MSDNCFKKFVLRLSISKQFIFRYLHDIELEQNDIDNFMDMIEDRNLYGILSGKSIEMYSIYNYIPEYVLPAQKLFRTIVLTCLDISEGDNAEVSYSIFYDGEFINISHIDCDVVVKFPTKESLNYFKIKKPKGYQSLVDYEAEKKEYDRKVEERRKSKI